jgi:predicted dehydrogenase
LFIAYYRRALPLFLQVKEIIDDGILGKPLAVNIRFYMKAPEEQLSGENLPWRFQPKIAGGGLFYDLASHKLDFLDFIFGPIAKVSGQAGNFGGFYPAEDTVSASFQFENGVMGTGSWCFVADASSEEDTIEIVGTKGKLWFSCFNPVKLTLKTVQGEISYDYENPKHVGCNLIQLLVDDLRGVGKCPSTGISAARTNWVMEEITKNYYSKEQGA